MKIFNNKRITILCSIIVITSLMISCSKQSNTIMPATSICDPNISFINTVKPILDRDCNSAGCHDDKVITALNIYQTVHDGAAQIRLSISTGKMPKNGTISMADKNAIFCWIDNGAKNN
jgi:hypothetical protein